MIDFRVCPHSYMEKHRKVGWKDMLLNWWHEPFLIFKGLRIGVLRGSQKLWLFLQTTIMRQVVVPFFQPLFSHVAYALMYRNSELTTSHLLSLKKFWGPLVIKWLLPIPPRPPFHTKLMLSPSFLLQFSNFTSHIHFPSVDWELGKQWGLTPAVMLSALIAQLHGVYLPFEQP